MFLSRARSFIVINNIVSDAAVPLGQCLFVVLTVVALMSSSSCSVQSRSASLRQMAAVS